MEVMLFPYLPLSKRITIGPWELIPKSQLTAADAIAPEMVEHAHGVADLYALPSKSSGFGAFVRHADGGVGDEIDRTKLSALHDAVVVPLLDRNPSRGDPEQDEDPNAGHRTCTTENALLYSHRFEPDLYIGYETGTMAITQHFGPKIGEQRELIAAPSDLKLPIMAFDLDDVYANALYEVLTNLADDDPDLPAAVRWFEIAWTNSAVVDAETRVVALRAAFDLLFGGNAQTETVRDRLSDFLDPAGTKTSREWTDHHGRTRTAELTDLGWWFQNFALLRNKIAHGGDLISEDFVFESAPHIWHAEWTLRRVFKKMLAERGHEDVPLDDYERITKKFFGD
jgi:hypothetical protein